ncbi:MAG TPA: hypothetical protein VNK03_06250 [Gammaproteobacteria bacterium]|nr:hypothetical protein [Gammaproteobacteria bacterium]
MASNTEELKKTLANLNEQLTEIEKNADSLTKEFDALKPSRSAQIAVGPPLKKAASAAPKSAPPEQAKASEQTIPAKELLDKDLLKRRSAIEADDGDEDEEFDLYDKGEDEEEPDDPIPSNAQENQELQVQIKNTQDLIQKHTDRNQKLEAQIKKLKEPVASEAPPLPVTPEASSAPGAPDEVSPPPEAPEAPPEAPEAPPEAPEAPPPPPPPNPSKIPSGSSQAPPQPASKKAEPKKTGPGASNDLLKEIQGGKKLNKTETNPATSAQKPPSILGKGLFEKAQNLAESRKAESKNDEDDDWDEDPVPVSKPVVTANPETAVISDNNNDRSTTIIIT